MIAGSYKGDKPINITGIDNVHLKGNVVDGSIVNGVRGPFLYSFVLSSPQSHEIFNEPGTRLFKKINKSVVSHIMFYLEHDDHKPVNYNGETISFTCRLIKI